MPKRISVVIAIRDWDPERLDLAVRSHTTSSIGADVELIVSDYGSSDPAPLEKVCAEHGCVYRYTEADVWSRSRALNAGLSLASADLMVTTDADIVFAPRTLEATVDFLTLNPRSVVLSQCADLGEEFSMERARNLHWPDIYDNAVLRPRWGMGGLCAFDRDTLETVRGFEERMTVWGAEDNDFVKRCRQAGRFLHWISGPEIGIYHVWHPRFLQTDPQANEIFEANKKILNEDLTTARNYAGPAVFSSRKPLVSVNIASFNRGHLIGDAIRSVLNQTVKDIEVLIYDDGSDDDTDEVVASFDDPRLRYIRGADNGGVANARNAMIEESKGQFICVHDDDDIMLPNRLQLQLDAMTAGYAGNYGGWVDFDADTGELYRRPGKEPFGVPTVAFVGSALLHPTLMVKRDVMKRLGYERSFRGGSDFNLAFRLANAGHRLRHCGDYVILRRVHSASLTGQSQDKQKLSARMTVAPFLNNVSSQVEKHLREEAKKVRLKNIDPTYGEQQLLSLLPDDLFDQLVEVTAPDARTPEADVSVYGADGAQRHFLLRTRRTRSQLSPAVISDGARIRVPGSASGSDGESENGARALRIFQTLREHLNPKIVGSVAVLEHAGRVTGDVRRATDLHAHLATSVAIVRYAGKDYVLVDAPTRAIATFVAHSVRSLLRPRPRAESLATAPPAEPSERACGREIH